MFFFYLKADIWNFSRILRTCCPSKIICKTISKFKLEVFPKTDIHSLKGSLYWSQDWSRHKRWVCRYKILIEIYPSSVQLKLIWTCAYDSWGQETQNSIYYGRRHWLWASCKRAQYYIYEFLFYIKKMNSDHSHQRCSDLWK